MEEVGGKTRGRRIQEDKEVSPGRGKMNCEDSCYEQVRRGRKLALFLTNLKSFVNKKENRKK